MEMNFDQIIKNIKEDNITPREAQVLYKISLRGRKDGKYTILSTVNIKRWMDESPCNLIGEIFSEVYDAYVEWSESVGVPVATKIDFGRVLSGVYGYKTVPRYVNGKSTRVLTA